MLSRVGVQPYCVTDFAIVWQFPTRPQARAFLKTYINDLLAISRGLQRTVQLWWSGCTDPFEVSPTFAQRYIEVTNVNVNQEYKMPTLTHHAFPRVNTDIARALDEILECDNGAGMVRLSDNQQIILNESATCTLGDRATLDDAVRWRRSDYWLAEDLDRAWQEWRSLEVNNPDSNCEITYLIGDATKGAGVILSPHQCIQRVTSRYRLVQDGNGILYHVAQNIAVEQL